MKFKELFTKKRVIWLIVILAIIGGGYALLHNSKSKPSVQYKTAAVTKGTMFFTVSGSGNVTVDKTAKVSPGVSGTVQSVNVKVGDSVNAGQTILIVKNDQLDVNTAKSYASYVQSKQAYQQSITALMQAQLNQTTVSSDPKSSAEQISIANQQLVVAQAGVTTARQNQVAASADYSYQLNTAAERTVTAPISGTITTLSLGVGDTVTAGQVSTSGTSTTNTAPIAIQDLSTFQVSVNINEADAPNVKAGQKATMTFDAISGLTATGTVQHIDTIGTSTSGVVTYAATISLDSIDSRIKPGMSTTAIITTNVKPNVLYVPSSAVKTSDGNTYVQTLQNNMPQQVNVTIGDANDTSTEITGGITEGEYVITQTITNKTTTSTTSLGGGLTSQGAPLRSLTGSGGGGRASSSGN